MVALVIIPFTWALFEAVFFFIVPDVWLTWLVISKRNWKQISAAILCATCGAILGGMIVYYLGENLPRLVIVNWLDQIPGISQSLIENISGEVDRDGVFSYLKGMWGGNPYKVYSAFWGERNGDLGLWVLISVVARASRFILTILSAVLINNFGERLINSWEQRKRIIFLIFWFCFYVFYFYHFTNIENL